MGCQFCHGADAKGQIGPNIVGRRAGEIAGAMDRVEAMGFIFLERHEIEAVAAYLDYLQSLETME
ncbi:MAG: hypothetical protein V3V35_05200 [Dehalococcoidia bacterium]